MSVTGVFVPLSDNVASTHVILTTAEDLNTDTESHVTTCVVFPRTWRKTARTLRTEHQRSPRTSPQHVRPI
ncbi:hypothetical protein Taro_001309 [Colocasia esculenta]|uniref:Uncharacterized protein n=1 Tax=Colocasia esculenta TaxID=4460 RepID=A0A843TFG7_COLES|nr:hypothetical protein [Colocasia esculenta]